VRQTVLARCSTGSLALQNNSTPIIDIMGLQNISQDEGGEIDRLPADEPFGQCEAEAALLVVVPPPTAVVAPGVAGVEELLCWTIIAALPPIYIHLSSTMPPLCGSRQ
jgi:hypothetical protein